MMKRVIATLLLTLAALASLAQNARPGDRPGAVPPPARYTVNFESRHGESFSVFIDGELQNRMPQTRVIVNNINGSTHEVIVVLKRPAEKAATLALRPGEPNVTVAVNYDRRLERLYLYTPEHNRPQDDPLAHWRNRQPGDKQPPAVVPPAPGQLSNPIPKPVVRVATDDEVDSMVVRMNQQPFDSDRLALGKVIVASANLTAAHIARLAKTIDFSQTQVEFLKYAYAYCIDKPNYHQAVEVLTFSSDKKKVLDYIATQR
jgi:hypothetical protein